MVIEFEKEYLKELYENGKTSNKKYRFQPQLIKQYKRTVDILKSAPDTEFLYKFKSLHYEKKEGNKKGIEAVYVNTQYRIEFESRIQDETENKITICSLLELSNHYK
jgi:proteic killer suppression protein